jgi:hypothetical protein
METMWSVVLESAGAFVAQHSPHTPPAAWVPIVRYTGEAIAALIIAGSARICGASRLASIAAAVGYVAGAGVADSLGLLVLAVTAMGAFGLLRLKPPFALVGVLLIVSVVTGVALLIWTVFALGLDEIRRSLNPGAGNGLRHRIAGATLVIALLLVVVAAPLPAAATSTPPAPQPLGHDLVTLTSLRALVSNIPSGSALVDDGPITNMLMRAMADDLARAHVDLARVTDDAAAVRRALASRRVFALPHAQRALQLRGFQVVDGLRVADRGLAEIVRGGDCADATGEWQVAAPLTGHATLALVADRESRRSPIVLFLMGDAPIRVEAVDWPPRTMRGFSVKVFDLGREEDRTALDAERVEYGGPTVDLTGRAFITRVELWRTPDAALAIPIHLSTPATWVAIRLGAGASPGVSICPAFPSPVQPIR